MQQIILPSNAKKMWTPQDQATYSRNATNRKLLEGDHEAILYLGDKTIKRKYVSVNILGDMLTSKIAEFTVPSLPEFEVRGTYGQQKAIDGLVETLDFGNLIHQIPIIASVQGQTHLKITWADGLPKVSVWGNKSGEYVTRGKNSVTFWYLISPDSMSGREGIAVGETYTVSSLGLKVENKAYKTEAGFPIDVPIPLSQVDFASLGIEAPVESYLIPRVSNLPYACVNNVDSDGDGDPDSDYTKGLVTLQAVINWITTLRQSIVDYCEFPVIEVSTPGTGDDELNFDALKMTATSEDGQPRVKISGWTGNMENSEKQLNYYLDQFHLQSGLPKSLFGYPDGGNDSGYARRLSLLGFERMIERRRSQYHTPILHVFQTSMQLQQAYKTSDVKPIDNLTIRWPEIVPEAKSDTEASIIKQFEAGIITKDEARTKLGYL